MSHEDVSAKTYCLYNGDTTKYNMLQQYLFVQSNMQQSKRLSIRVKTPNEYFPKNLY